MTTRAEWQQLAEDRILDAQAHLAVARWSAAYYLIGYAVECGLNSKLLLEDIADLILTSDAVRFVIEGHTERGDARASFYLSERRAMAVLERLAKLGVPEFRMLSVGYGDTRPIDENSSYEGRMRNRRVEIRVLGRI